MLQQLITQRCRVVRDGTLSEIEARDLVPGDVINLEEGDLVPTDARLLEAVYSFYIPFDRIMVFVAGIRVF